MDISNILPYMSYMNSASVLSSSAVEGSTDSMLSGSLFNGLVSNGTQSFANVLYQALNPAQSLDQSIIKSQLADCVEDNCTCKSSEFTKALYEYYQNQGYSNTIKNTNSQSAAGKPVSNTGTIASMPSVLEPSSIKSQIETSIKNSISIPSL